MTSSVSLRNARSAASPSGLIANEANLVERPAGIDQTDGRGVLVRIDSGHRMPALELFGQR